MLEDKYKKMSGNYNSGIKCRGCDGTDVSWEQKQTTGADEAVNVFCECVKCRNRRKMS